MDYINSLDHARPNTSIPLPWSFAKFLKQWWVPGKVVGSHSLEVFRNILDKLFHCFTCSWSCCWTGDGPNGTLSACFQVGQPVRWAELAEGERQKQSDVRKPSTSFLLVNSWARSWWRNLLFVPFWAQQELWKCMDASFVPTRHTISSGRPTVPLHHPH